MRLRFQKMNAGVRYILLPFKGNYWDIKYKERCDIKTNIYPVPDLKMPFLGIHFTPNAYNDKVSIGPTATLALGRENYVGLEGIEFSDYIKHSAILAKQYLLNQNNIRKYVHEQSEFRPLLIEGQEIIMISTKHLY